MPLHRASDILLQTVAVLLLGAGASANARNDVPDRELVLHHNLEDRHRLIALDTQKIEEGESTTADLELLQREIHPNPYAAKFQKANQMKSNDAATHNETHVISFYKPFANGRLLFTEKQRAPRRLS